MSRITTLAFDTPGPENTEATLEISAERAEVLGISEIVVATSTGRTALQAAQAMPGKSIIGVTLQRGVWEKYVAPDPATVQAAEALGVRFLTCPHALMGSVDSAVQQKFGGLPPGEFISHVYYTLSQGVKVAVECALMAADAGLLSMSGDIISIAGTNDGADTSIVMTPVFSHQFFDVRIREVLAKPR